MHTIMTRRAALKVAAVWITVLMILTGCADKEPQNVRITPASATLQVGETAHFDAEAVNKAGERLTDVPITWSLEGDAGQISDQGLFTALKPGQAVVTAQGGSFSASAAVTVTPPIITTLRVAADREQGLPGSQLNLTVTAADANGRPAAWATVNLTPTHKAMRLSTTTLVLDEAGTGAVNVSLPPQSETVAVVVEGGEALERVNLEATRVTRITIEPGAGPYEAGQTVDFQAVGHDDYGNSTPIEVDWTLTGDAADIAPDGRITMLEPGDGVVLATYGDVVTGQPFTVEAGIPAAMVVSPDQASLQAGNAVIFQAEARNQYGYPLFTEVTWEVEADIGAVSEDGFFEARKVGEGRVVARSHEAAGFADISVVHGPLASVSIDIEQDTITAGETIDLKAFGLDTYDNPFNVAPEWYISRTLGQFDRQNNTFTARYAGRGEIRALVNGVSATHPIEVRPAEMVRLEIVPARADLIAGETVTFEVEGYDQFGNRVEVDPAFSLTDEIGVLEPDGRFGARLSGSTVVMAAAATLEARAAVTVTPADMVRVTLEPSETLTLKTGDRQQLAAQGYDEFGNVVASEVQWKIVPDLGDLGPRGSFFPQRSGKGQIAATLTQPRTGIVMGVDLPVTVDPGPTARIDLTPEHLQIEAGAEHPFAATAYDEFGNLTGADIHWSIAGTLGAVDEQGVFRSQKAGDTMVRALIGGVFALAEVQVTPSEVAYLKIVPSEIELSSGAAVRLHVIGEDRYGNTMTPEVTWSLTHPDLGHMAADGQLTALRAGDGMVLATSRNLVDRAPLRVHPSELVTIVVQPPSTTLEAGDSIRFQARGFDAGGNEIEIDPVWSVKGETGVIDASGTFQGRVRDAETVLAGAEGLHGEAQVQVTSGPPAEILVTPDSLELAAGESQSFTVQIKDGYGNIIQNPEYTWLMTPDLGTVAAGDVFTARTTGQGELHLTAGPVSIELPVAVRPGPLAHIHVQPESLETAAGDRVTFTAEGFDAFGNAVVIEPEWSITGALGLFTASGVFEARRAGTGHLVAAVRDVSGTASVAVTPGPVTHVQVLPPAVRLEAGQQADFKAQGYDAHNNPIDGMDYVWTVEDAEVGSMSPQGTFLARNARSSEILVTAASVTGRAEVEVVPAALEQIQVQPSEFVLASGARETLVVSGRDHFNNPIPIDAVVAVVPEQLGEFVAPAVFEARAAGEGSIIVKAGNLQQTLPVRVTVGKVVRIDIHRPEEDILAARTYDFSAVGFDAGGNAIPVEARWAVSTDIGSIDPDTGRFYARKAGQGVVTARWEDIKTFQWIEVAAGQLFSFFVAPSPVTLQSGDSLEFTVEGLDAEDNPVIVDRHAVQWDVEGRIGSFEQPGVFRAAKMGKGKVTATIGDLLGQSHVTVEPGAPDPASARVRLNYPILPADGTATSEIRILIRDFHDNPVPGARVSLASNRQADVLVQPPVTDDAGATRGSIRSHTSGRAIISAILEGAVIPVRTEVLFE